ncbi:MAG TPA: hypothetical protein H9684_03865 [Firmicutes bacterium]|nr:hypothetical protein [Bacillota bacterium]
MKGSVKSGVKKGARAVLAAAPTAAAACWGVSAQGASPVTGEPFNPLPFIIAGVAAVLVIALIVLSFLTKKKK